MYLGWAAAWMKLLGCPELASSLPQSAGFTVSACLNAIFAPLLPQIAVAWHSGSHVWSLSGPVHQRMEACLPKKVT